MGPPGYGRSRLTMPPFGYVGRLGYVQAPAPAGPRCSAVRQSAMEERRQNHAAGAHARVRGSIPTIS